MTEPQNQNSAAVGRSELSGLVSRRTATMVDAVKILQDYWNTYDRQSGYANYHMETFIDDALYGLGIAIDRNQFEFASGYERFKSILREHLAATAPMTKNEDTATLSGVGSSDVLYVLAGEYRQAKDLAMAYEYPKNRLRYIDDSYKLRGIDGKGKTLFVYGTAVARDDYQECVRLATERGFKVVRI